MTSRANEWEPAPALPATQSEGARGFLEFAAANKAWWIVPALLVSAVLALLVLLARGDLQVPDGYRLH